jgi:hypothetical protein
MTSHHTRDKARQISVLEIGSLFISPKYFKDFLNQNESIKMSDNKLFLIAVKSLLCCVDI